MKKYNLLFLFGFLGLLIQAQAYRGFHSSSHSGIHSVLTNPASLAGSKSKVDINLISFDVLASNDFLTIDLGDLENFDSNDEVAAKNSFVLSADILGPSFSFGLGDKSSIGFISRGRIMANIKDMNGDLMQQILGSDNGSDQFNVNSGKSAIVTNSWLEAGINYSRILYEQEKHHVRAGLTAKLLFGAASSSLGTDNLTYNYDANNVGSEISTSGNLQYNYSNDFFGDNFEFSDITDNLGEGVGLGADLGFVYEFRPDNEEYVDPKNPDNLIRDENKYLLKIGVGITDLGKVKYKDAQVSNYNLNRTGIDESEFEIGDGETLEDMLNRIYPGSTTGEEELSINLPTAFQGTIDLKVLPKFYVNASTQIALTRSNSAESNRVLTHYTLSPRYESRLFDFWSPIGIDEFSNFTWGAGFRFGPLFVGSGSVLSSLINQESKIFDAYAGLKVPLFHKKDKDIDGDGVSNKEDACPKVAGPAENNGCPWPDTDGDGVTDNIDKCPEEVGDPENHGCPWGDVDKDGITDNLDECIAQAGPAENNGCPWPDKDRDGVFDKDDECPETMGSKDNKGCPKVITIEEKQQIVEEIVDKINIDFNILFKTNSDVLTPNSYTVLLEKSDLIKEALDTHDKAKFLIAGHTDTKGSAEFNLKLSQKRAESVRKALIDYGVPADALQAKGFGETVLKCKPEKTEEDYACNRRVEVLVVHQ